MRSSGVELLILLAGLAATGACGGDRPPAEPAESAALPEAGPEAEPALPPLVTTTRHGPIAPVPDPKLAAKAGLTVQPSKGQSQPQQVQDEQACYQWAQEQSSMDPAAVAVNPDSAGKTARKPMAICLQVRGYAVN